MRNTWRTTVAAVLTLALAGAAQAQNNDTGNLRQYPTASQPWENEVLASRRDAYEKGLRQRMTLPAERVQALPAAADFPGLPPAEAPTETRTIRVRGGVPRWQGTGLYARPGQLITVTVPPRAASAGLQVRIGCHTDELWDKSITTWTRAPQITRAFPITQEVTRAANGFGGLVYIDVPEDAPRTPWQVTIEGGVPAPRFVLDQTPARAWRDELRHAPAPWAELECKGLILTVPSEMVRDLDDPIRIMRFWQEVVDAQDELVGNTGRTFPERFVFDRQISAGYMHSGYPLMGPVDAAPALLKVPVDRSQANYAVLWGVFHEIGHNLQADEWTFEGTEEVTNNVLVLHTIEKVCGMHRHRGISDMDQAQQDQRLRAYLRRGSFPKWKEDPFLALTMYDQLIDRFGFPSLQQVFTEYRGLADDERPKNDQQKRDQFLVRMSRAVGHNLGPFFQRWKVPTSQAARDSIADLPEWGPEWPATTQGPLRIDQATWGAPDGPSIDVTPLVTDHVADNTVELKASTATFGDPAENMVKQLKVVYRVGASRYTRTIREGDTLWLTGKP